MNEHDRFPECRCKPFFASADGALARAIANSPCIADTRQHDSFIIPLPDHRPGSLAHPASPVNHTTRMTTSLTAELGRAPERGRGLMNNRKVYDRMHGEILSGILRPDSKLNIAGLAAAMDVSAGAVREALAMLEADSLVISEPHRGYRVMPVSAVDLRTLVAARIEIEKLCIADAVTHGDDAWEGSVLAAFHRLSKQHERDAANGQCLSAAWTTAHAEYHHAIARGCTNIWLLRMHTMLYTQSERYRQLSVPGGEVERDVLGEHKALCDALLGRDASLAVSLMTNHLQTTADLVLASSFVGKRVSGKDAVEV